MYSLFQTLNCCILLCCFRYLLIFVLIRIINICRKVKCFPRRVDPRKKKKKQNLHLFFAINFLFLQTFPIWRSITKKCDKFTHSYFTKSDISPNLPFDPRTSDGWANIKRSTAKCSIYFFIMLLFIVLYCFFHFLWSATLFKVFFGFCVFNFFLNPQSEKINTNNSNLSPYRPAVTQLR